MKKLTSLLLAFVLLIGLIPTVHGAESETYIVTADFASVYKSPAETSEKLAEISKNTYVEISEIRNGEFGRIYFDAGNVTGWILMESVTLYSRNEENTAVREIKITSLPEKLTYTDGLEELDLSGLTVSAVDKDGKEFPVTGYNVYTPEMKDPGEKTVLVTYSPDGINIFEASFKVNVVRVPVKEISIVNMPVLTYMEHHTLDLSGLSVSVEFPDSSMNKTLTYEELSSDSDFILTSCHGEKHGTVLEKGQHTFTISYKYSDVSCSFTVDVTPRKLTSLEILAEPSVLTVYDKTKHPAIDGLILKAFYDNGETEEIYHYNCKTVCDPSEFVIGPGNEVKVYFGDLYVTVYFRYTESKEIQGIKLKTPVVLTFLKGEPIDLSGLRVYLYYTDGSFTEVKNYEMTEIDYTVSGTQNIAVTYKEYSEVFSVMITPVFSKGDVNGDGKISAIDARQVLRASVGIVELGGKTFFAGDADRNGKITAMDARLILRASVDLENLYVTI